MTHTTTTTEHDATSVTAGPFRRMVRTMCREIESGARSVTGKLENGVHLSLSRSAGLVLYAEDSALVDAYEASARALGYTAIRWDYEADDDLPAESYLRIVLR